MAPSPTPRALLPSPPLRYGFFPVPTLLMWWATVAISQGPLWRRKKRKRKKSQTPTCLLLELSRLFSRGCVNPRTVKGNSYVNQTSAPCSPPSPLQLPYIKWLFSSLRNDRWLVALLLAFSIFSFMALDSGVESCFFLLTHLVDTPALIY